MIVKKKIIGKGKGKGVYEKVKNASIKYRPKKYWSIYI
jgi:hypothetical protein